MNRLLSRLGLRHGEHISVARDFSIYSIVNVGSLVLLLGTALVLRRYLGAVQAGVWITLDLLPKYAQYAPLGLLNAAERDLPYLLGAGQLDEFDRRKHTLFWVSNAIGITLTVLVAAGALIFRPRMASPELFSGTLAYAPLLWMQILAAYYVVIYRARRRFVELSTRQGIANFTKAVLTMAGGYWFGLYGVFGALLVSSAVQLVLFHTGLAERFEPVFERRILAPMVIAGLPMLLGAVAFETIRNADQIVIPLRRGLETAGFYSVVAIVCQGIFYFPNTLGLVMFPRFQERYGKTQTMESLRKFVELPLHVLSEVLLAAIAVLLVALPPALLAFLPDYSASIPPLRVMLVATYFLCLSPPAGQFLLTIHKQIPVLFIAIPAMIIALVAAYIGTSYGLVGVATGIAIASFLYFVTINAYAFSHLGDRSPGVRPLATICLKAVGVLGVVWLIERFVAIGPQPVGVIGGWRLVAAMLLTLPLLASAASRVRAMSGATLG